MKQKPRPCSKCAGTGKQIAKGNGNVVDQWKECTQCKGRKVILR